MTILLALYEGGRHLAAQLESIAAQDEEDWSLLVSDDGSTDQGPAILAEFAARLPTGKVRVNPGPRRGAAANFLSMLARSPEEAPYTCFSDQDDVWLPHKLSRAIARLEAVDAGRPALYFSRTMVCGPELEAMYPSPSHKRQITFRNALVQNIAPGNTMVFNAEALRLLKRAASRARDVGLHDWWVYQVLSGAGATMIYDDLPTLLYRQHGGNLIGINDGFMARIRRLRKVQTGADAEGRNQNLRALHSVADLLTSDSRDALDHLLALRRERRRLRRLRIFFRSGLYRQTGVQQLRLLYEVTFGKI